MREHNNHNCARKELVSRISYRCADKEFAMPTPKRTKRGIKDPRIMHSLATLYARDHRKYNPHAIAAYFIRNPEAYCKKSTENGEPRIPSESTIRAAAAGKPIEPYFHECIKSWIRNVDPDLMPRGLRWVDLDLPGFFGSSPNKMAQLGKNLQGHYQNHIEINKMR